MTHLAKVLWPETGNVGLNVGGGGGGTLDLTDEQVAFVGYCRLEAGSGSKTISTTGPGKIAFRLAAGTFGSASTTIEIGIQDVAGGTGPPMQPIGGYDVKTTVAGPSGLTLNTWMEVSMNNGSKTITDGDLIAIVFNMTARAGGDVVTFTCPSPYGQVGLPSLLNYTASTWTLVTNRLPTCLITFDDGTHGVIDYTLPISAQGTEDPFTNATAQDERGMQFTPPYNCVCDGAWVMMNGVDQNSGCTLRLFQTPVSSASVLATSTIVGRHLSNVSGNTIMWFWKWPSPVNLTAGTLYGLALRATGTTNNELRYNTMGHTAWNKFVGGTDFKKITRDNDTGNFTVEATPLTWYLMGVRIEPSAAAPSGGVSFHAHMSG